MIQKKRILNTVICYNNPLEVVNYAKKLSSLEDSDSVCLIITINSIDDNLISELRNAIIGIKLEILIYNPKKNLGYMNGMIFGYNYYKTITDNHTPDYVIMSNTDINYPDLEFISKLLSNKYGSEIWVIGPAVYVPFRKSYDNPIADQRRSLDDINLLIKKFSIPVLNELYIIASLVRGKLFSKKIGKAREVYEVHGCYFIIKGLMANLLIESPFGALLYSEETYIAEMAYKKKKIAYYDPRLLVNHIEHTVTSKIKTKNIAKHLHTSMKIIKRDFY